jgi:hypothetical protein
VCVDVSLTEASKKAQSRVDMIIAKSRAVVKERSIVVDEDETAAANVKQRLIPNAANIHTGLL